jgi:hypothetical protein
MWRMYEMIYNIIYMQSLIYYHIIIYNSHNIIHGNGNENNL